MMASLTITFLQNQCANEIIIMTAMFRPHDIAVSRLQFDICPLKSMMMMMMMITCTRSLAVVYDVLHI